MNDNVRDAIRELLDARKVLSLAVVFDGHPEQSLLPYAVAPDCSGVYVQASQLARHTQALTQGARVSVLVHGLDTEGTDPLQITRLSMLCEVEPLDRDGDRFAAGSDVFVARFPSAAVTLGFDDFGLFALRFQGGRYVAGFAQAFDVDPRDIRRVSAR